MPGVVHLARWITAATAILRLFCQTIDPSDVLLRLVRFICGCYVPLYFKIKADWHIINGARLFHLTHKLAKLSTGKDDYKIVSKYIDVNSYFGHPENVLLAAVFDPDLKIREKAVQCISNVRQYWSSRPGFRQFKIEHDKIDWNSAHYYDFYKWDTLPKSHYCSPPLLRDFSLDDLWAQARGSTVLNIPEIPCHSQAVERWIQDTAKAAATQIGYKKRHAFLLNLEQNRKSFPTNAKSPCFM